MIEKRPRQYAEEILKLPTRELRAEYLAKVPEHLQSMVKQHVEHAFMIKRNLKT
jgi:hypothetical protein